MLYREIETRLRAAVLALEPAVDRAAVQVRPCPDPKFGDYQSSSIIAIARQRKRNPRELANQLVERLTVSDLCENVEIAGAGFINFRLAAGAVRQALTATASGTDLFFAPVSEPRTIVVDFSSPNVAKPMHVGHIRSTILGDSLARMLRLLGHHVITDNHIGDWGTQFGKLLVGWESVDRSALESDPLSEMERLYKKVNAACESDPVLLERARQELVRLQQGEPGNLAIWREMLGLSQVQFEQIYRRLGVNFDHMLGESAYNEQLPRVIEELKARGLARESEGALMVYFDDVPQLKKSPAMVQKSDGGYNYMTTDLATLRHRLDLWKAQQIIYVTDARQQLHFQQLFATFRRWLPDAPVKLDHVWFGSILGEDGKPFKTRSGETVRLSELLDEAEQRAFQTVSEKNEGLPEPQRREIARAVGIGAVKYADLLPNRQSDYVFSWDKMLALNGNTAPYLQYAYARIQSIFRKGGLETEGTGQELAGSAGTPGPFSAPEELSLAKHLLNFGLVLETAAEEFRPNYICNYLYELAGHFTRFYENCPVLKAAGPEKATRLMLCSLTGRVLKQGLAVLGIETLEQM